MKNPRFANIHTVSDIVDTMIRGLKREWVRVRMYSFGKSAGNICYGCAATNTLCELMQEPFNPETISSTWDRAKQFNFDIERDDLQIFECAIDYLRNGSLHSFLNQLSYISDVTGVPISKRQRDKIVSYQREKTFWHKERKLPALYDDNYKENLVYYEKFRDWLIKKGL